MPSFCVMVEHRGITQRGPCPSAVLRAARPWTFTPFRVRSPYEHSKSHKRRDKPVSCVLVEHRGIEPDVTIANTDI